MKASAQRSYDLVTIGRSSIDLFSNDVGSAFVDIQSFAAYVGGSPTNIAVGCQRLGMRSALLTAVGQDPVGDFILQFLRREGVDTDYIPRKPGYRTSAVLLGIEPPDKYPLVYYRADAADIQLTIDDVQAAPIDDSRILEISGTGLSRDPSRTATIYAAEWAQALGTKVFLDLDFRPDQWHDPRAFGAAIRGLLPLVDVVIGTVDEVKAAVLRETAAVTVEHSQMTAARVEGELGAAIERLLASGPEALVVKRGPDGASVYTDQNSPIEAPGFSVEILNEVGAGDAFASGLIYGYAKGWDWYRSARMGNATGAIVVTRHGCANFMPYEDEALQFIEARGGF